LLQTEPCIKLVAMLSVNLVLELVST
jgi:hypothetical protein